MSWTTTLVLSKILVYISDDFKIKITSVFGSPDFANIQLFILLRICICLIFVHFLLAMGSLLRIKFFRILHQGLWNFKAFAVSAGFAGLIFVPVQIIKIFLKSLTLILALNFLVNLYVLLRHKKSMENNKCTCFSEVALNALIIANLFFTNLYGESLLTLDGQRSLYIATGTFLILNIIRCFRKSYAYYLQNLILQLYCMLLLWTGWLLIQEKNHLEKVTIAFSTTIGVMNLIIPTIVVFSSKSFTYEDVAEDEIHVTEISTRTEDEEEEEDMELNNSFKSRKKNSSKSAKKKKLEEKRKLKVRKQNSRVSLVHFSFMFLVSYFLETFICLENLEENLWKFHSHPYIFFIIASLCILLVLKLTK